MSELLYGRLGYNGWYECWILKTFEDDFSSIKPYLYFLFLIIKIVPYAQTKLFAAVKNVSQIDENCFFPPSICSLNFHKYLQNRHTHGSNQESLLTCGKMREYEWEREIPIALSFSHRTKRLQKALLTSTATAKRKASCRMLNQKTERTPIIVIDQRLSPSPESLASLAACAATKV